MKIRNGFVTNSSSSSFICSFDNKIKNINDVYNEFFNGKPNNSFLQIAANIIYKDCLHNGIYTKTEFINFLITKIKNFDIYIDDLPSSCEYDNGGYELALITFLNDFLDNHLKGTYFLLLENYEDEMENEDLFKNVQHYTINEH